MNKIRYSIFYKGALADKGCITHMGAKARGYEIAKIKNWNIEDVDVRMTVVEA